MGKKFVSFGIIEETEAMGKPTGKKKASVAVTLEEAKKLANKYGIYGFDWYFVNDNTIKHFDNKSSRWKYDKLSQVV